MKKFIPYEKLSKKKQRELNAVRRSDWGEINPVTRRSENPKAYNRKKARKWSDESSMTVPFDILRSAMQRSKNTLLNLFIKT